MLNSHLIVKSPPQLCDLERFFLRQIDIPEQRVTPIALPFYNFTCYAIDMLSQYAKCTLDLTFNVFLVDAHLRKYSSSIELYRRFIGFVNSWKKYTDTDEAKLLLTFLRPERNGRKNVRLFLKLRKILLKNLNHKILQQIQLTHEDAVTIVHTLDMISSEQRKILTKKINEYFITKNVKYVNNAKFNAAIICEYFMHQINDKGGEIEKFNSNLSNKITKILKNQLGHIEEFEQENLNKREISFCNESLSNQFESAKQATMPGEYYDKCNQNINPIEVQSHESQGKKPLVNLQKCMKELYILKEKDLEIDNRFKKLNKSREQLEQY